MKFSYLLLAMTLFLTSCSKEEPGMEALGFSATQFPQKWILVKMTGNSVETPAYTGENMYWQENYVFNADGSFLKTRIKNGESTTAEGNYTVSEEDQTFILNHHNRNPLIGNCNMGNTEYLSFDKNRVNLLSNWWACDGPGLFYKRIE